MPIKFVNCDGPVDPATSLVSYDVPVAPEDARRSAKLRQKYGLPPVTPETTPDRRVSAAVDSFIPPRQWVEDGVRWEQHASPFPSPRIDVVRLREKLHGLLTERGGQTHGLCPIRRGLYNECMLEVMRQTLTESWERGLLLLAVYRERTMTMDAHSELLDSRTGYAFRLALKGEKDTAAMANRVEHLKARRLELAREEEDLKVRCEQLTKYNEEKMREDEKRFSDELNALKKEMNHKKAQLESLTVPVPKK